MVLPAAGERSAKQWTRGPLPTLTGLGERAHLFQADVDCHIDDVVAVLHYEDLRNAILVGHSYGGAVRNVERLRAKADGRVWDIDTGHDLMITEPHKVAELLGRIAALTAG